MPLVEITIPACNGCCNCGVFDVSITGLTACPGYGISPEIAALLAEPHRVTCKNTDADPCIGITELSYGIILVVRIHDGGISVQCGAPSAHPDAPNYQVTAALFLGWRSPWDGLSISTLPNATVCDDGTYPLTTGGFATVTKI